MATAYQFNEEVEEYAKLVSPAGAPAQKTVPARPAANATGDRRVVLTASEGGPYKVVPNEAVREPERILRLPRRTLLASSGKKPAIVEFYTVKSIDNSRLVRRIEPVKLRNYYKTLLLGGMVALFCMFYVYQHFRCIDLSFQLEDLKAKQMQAQSLNSELKLEIETLRDPARIDVIAQKELGLKRPESAQVREYGNSDGGEVAAMQVRSVVSRR
jgi:cell division protein FtsL